MQYFAQRVINSGQVLAESDTAESGIPCWVWIALAAFLGLAAGVLICKLLGKRKPKNEMPVVHNQTNDSQSSGEEAAKSAVPNPNQGVRETPNRPAGVQPPPPRQAPAMDVVQPPNQPNTPAQPANNQSQKPPSNPPVIR